MFGLFVYFERMFFKFISLLISDAYSTADIELSWHNVPISSAHLTLKTTGYVVEKVWAQSARVGFEIGSELTVNLLKSAK